MNHLVILSAQLNWNTSATELAQKKETPEKIEVALFSDYDNKKNSKKQRIFVNNRSAET